MPYSLRLIGLAISITLLSSLASAQVQSSDPNYTVSLFASGLTLPELGMSFRPATNDFLVTEATVGQIARVDAATGSVSVFATLPAGTPSRAGDGFDTLAISSGGSVLAPVYNLGGPIFSYSSTGVLLGTFPIANKFPRAMTFDSAGNLYIAAQPPSLPLATTIYEYANGDLTAQPTVFADGFGLVQGMQFNAAGQLLVVDRNAGILYQVTPGGLTASSHTILAGGFTLPDSLLIDPSTQVIYVGGEDDTVSKVGVGGNVQTFATGFAQPNNLSAMGFDASGNIYIEDTWLGAIWKFTRNVPTPVPTITPNHGGNTGTVTVRITGQGLESGAVVTLTGSGPDIAGTNIFLSSPSTLKMTFDLTGTSPGARNVEIANPDGTVLQLANAFTVEDGGSSEISLSLIGLGLIRANSTQNYYGVISNTGNIDAPIVESTFDLNGISQSGLLARSQSSLQFAMPIGGLNTVGALSTVILPLPITAPPPGVGPACQVFGGGVRTLKPSDLCAQLKQAMLLARATLNALYVARLTNIKELAAEALPLGYPGARYSCYANPGQIQQCDFLDQNDKSLKNQIELTKAERKAICTQAAAIGCDVGCSDPLPSALSLLGDIADGSVRTYEVARTAPPDKVTWQQQLYAYSIQTLQLPTSLVFPTLPPPPPPPITPDSRSLLQVCTVASLDPNSMIGPDGVTTNHFVPGTFPLTYGVAFENSPQATAWAKTVTITGQLDPNLDTSSLAFDNIQIGPRPAELYGMPANSTARIDLRPAQNLMVDVAITVVQHSLTITLNAIDPTTGQPPTDPTAGFLPPDFDPPAGEGIVTYTVKPLLSAPTGVVVVNQAQVIFDTNPPISTNAWSNVIDNAPPSSHIVPLPGTTRTLSFSLSWMGADPGSGLQDFTIYISIDGGVFIPWLTNTSATSATYTGQNGHTYSFYSIARDLVGNVEAAKTAAEATTTVSVPVGTDNQIQILLNASTIPYRASTVVTVKILPGPDPTHAPKGTAELFVDGSAVTTLTLGGAGHGNAAAYYNLSGLGAGSHNLYAVYSGDTLNPPGTSQIVQLQVVPSPVRLPVSCINPVLISGDDYKCKVFTEPIDAGSNTAITYQYDNGAPVTVPLNGGLASFSISKPPVGSHTVVISYAAQGNYAAATPQTESFTVVARH